MSNLGYRWSCSGGSSSGGLPGSRESSNLRTVASKPLDAPDVEHHDSPSSGHTMQYQRNTWWPDRAT
jgi:hypothetical protein